jgi:hypothetical protein
MGAEPARVRPPAGLRRAIAPGAGLTWVVAWSSCISTAWGRARSRRPSAAETCRSQSTSSTPRAMWSSDTGAVCLRRRHLRRREFCTETTLRSRAFAGGIASAESSSSRCSLIVQQGRRQVLPGLPPADTRRRLHRGLLPGRRQRELRHRLPGQVVLKQRKV